MTWRKGIASFGSGTIFSNEVADDITIGELVSSNLSFWAVTDADMPILQQDSFQAIFGIGPPSSALKFAEEEAKQIRTELSQFIAQGNEITPEIKEMVARYEGTLKHAQSATPFTQTIGLTSMSVCFLKESGSGGFHIWHDDAVRLQPSKFATIPVVGEKYWSALMTDVGFGTVESQQVIADSNPFSQSHTLGCTDRACSAVLDTGSTLISAPSAVVNEIHAIVSQWVNAGGNCDDLSGLPDLELTLGGVKLALPAESYMGMAYGQLASDAKDLMPNYVQQVAEIETCQPLIMSMDVDTEDGPLWILGMSFFRKYYTNFAFSESQAAVNMSFSVADAACEPGGQPADSDLLIGRVHPKRRSQFRVDMSKIRVPTVVSRARAISSALDVMHGSNCSLKLPLQRASVH